MRYVLCAAALAILGGAALADENWPQFRGPAADGHSDATGLPLTWGPGKNITWKTPIHGRGWSSPVIWGDQIWMTTATTDGKMLYASCARGDTGIDAFGVCEIAVAEGFKA